MLRAAIWPLAVWAALVLCLPGDVRAQAPATAGEEFPVFRELERIASDHAETKANRLAAIDGLGKSAHPSVVPALLALLTNPDPELRVAAATALGWKENQAAVGPLLARATDAQEPVEIRVAAIGALGQIGDAAALAAIEALAKDTDHRIRREALLALIESPLLRHADGVPVAITLLGDLEQDGHARSRAASFLGSAKDPRAVEPLIEALQDVRPPAGFAELPSPEGLTGQAKTFAERLRSLHNVRAHAAYALGLIGDPRAVPPLLKALGDPDHVLRIQATGALGRLRAREAVPKMIEALEDPHELVRQVAATALGVLDDPSAEPALRRALADQESGVRVQAALALGRLGAQGARESLTKLADEDPAPTVRQAARAALRRLDASKPAPQ